MKPDINQDTIMQGVANTLLMITLQHNAAIVELSAKAITAGPLKQSAYKKLVADYRRMHKHYDDKFNECVKQAEEQFSL